MKAVCIICYFFVVCTAGEKLCESTASDVRLLCSTLLNCYLIQVGSPCTLSDYFGKTMAKPGFSGSTMFLPHFACTPYLTKTRCKSMLTDWASLCAAQLLETGLLHADPHPGNLLRTADGRICILDFG